MRLIAMLQELSNRAELIFPTLARLSLGEILLSAAATVAAWLAIRAAGAVVGEYAKRIWFRFVHRDAKKTETDALVRARQEIEQLRREVAALRQTLADQQSRTSPSGPQDQPAERIDCLS